jgi:uncharacterized protein (TIGR02996 family)
MEAARERAFMATQRFGPTVIETAAESLDELGLLSAIMEDQLDEAPKLVNADWLEERGDARGTFLRELVRLAGHRAPCSHPVTSSRFRGGRSPASSPGT